MRRGLQLAEFIAGAIVALALIVVASDWLFWKRFVTLPAKHMVTAIDWYEPREAVPGIEAPPLAILAGSEHVISATALDKALSYVKQRPTVAFIVMHAGRIELEFYGAGYSAASVTDSQSMHKSVLGLLIVGVIYMAMNIVYVYAMPTSAIAKVDAVAYAAAASLFSPAAAVWLSATIAVACFGAAASCALGGGRIFYAMAKDGVFFPKMAEVHPRFRTPAFSLIVQGVWAAMLTLSGRYDQLYTYVIFMMVLFYVLAVAGLFILRWKRPDVPRPYRCTGYPWLPGIYLLVAAAWTLNTLVERPAQALWGVGVVLVLGTPIFLYCKWKSGMTTDN